MIETHLLIDDIRDLNTDVIARTYEHGMRCLLNLQVTHLYLDHDLGPHNGDKSGVDILNFLFGYPNCFLFGPPKFIQLVTSNPVGRENMANILKDNGYKTKDGINFENK